MYLMEFLLPKNGEKQPAGGLFERRKKLSQVDKKGNRPEGARSASAVLKRNLTRSTAKHVPVEARKMGATEKTGELVDTGNGVK